MDQYFTENIELLKCLSYLLSLSEKNTQTLLEPSCGKCDILKYILNHNHIKLENITAIEIDSNLKQYPFKIIYDDFLKYEFQNKFDIIIGNPPFSLSTLFLKKCLSLLNDSLIFIVPSDTFRLTRNKKLIEEMYQEGSISHYIIFKDTSLFKKANIECIIFRYVKNKKKRTINYQIVEKNKEFQTSFLLRNYTISNGKLIFIPNIATKIQIQDLFSVYVGFVCGAEHILIANENETKNVLTILKSENIRKKFYDFKSYEDVYEKILTQKSKLMSRKITKFNDNNWFLFGLKRNESIIKENIGKKCLYVYCQTRKENVCFKGNVEIFGSNLLCLIPKDFTTDKQLEETYQYLNTEDFKKDFKSDNTKFKISQSQLCSCFLDIPINIRTN